MSGIREEQIGRLLEALTKLVEAHTQAIREGKNSKLSLVYRKVQCRYRNYPNGEQEFDLWIKN